MNTLTKIIQKMLGQTPVPVKRKKRRSIKKRKLKELKPVMATLEVLRGRDVFLMDIYR